SHSANPRHLVTRARRGDLPNSLVNGVHEEEISGTVDRHTSWKIQLSGSRGSAVPAKTKTSISRHSGDRSLRGHLSNSLVKGVRDEEISGAVDRHTSWARETKLRRRRRSAVPARTITSISLH